MKAALVDLLPEDIDCLRTIAALPSLLFSKMRSYSELRWNCLPLKNLKEIQDQHIFLLHFC